MVKGLVLGAMCKRQLFFKIGNCVIDHDENQVQKFFKNNSIGAKQTSIDRE